MIHKVIANRDILNKFVTKGTEGKVISDEYIDSELYYNIILEDGRFLYTSCESCWDTVE